MYELLARGAVYMSPGGRDRMRREAFTATVFFDRSQTHQNGVALNSEQRLPLARYT